jgi:dolichol-phosphate mannosyltransferase
MIDPPEYSVVVPFYNEEGSLEALLAEIRTVMDALGRSYEVVAVNDGSRDATSQKLQATAAGWPACRVLDFSVNRGQAAALWAGFKAARGSWIVTLDGDGQNVPADIPALIALTREADMAVGIRARRKDSAGRRAMSRIANCVRRRVLGDGLSDSGCALKVFRREVLDSFLPIRSLYSFIPAFAHSAGFKLAEAPVQHRERQSGRSNYGFGTFAWKPLMDMVTLWWFFHRRIPGVADHPARPARTRADSTARD